MMQFSTQRFGLFIWALIIATSASAYFAKGTICSAGEGSVLDRREILESHEWWDNRDFDWYEDNIPFLETPNQELDTTWYYRWDMMTKHLVYGSPEHGYACTEFIDRPPWSGTYGSISCPVGFQLYDMRWFRDPRFARDYAAYWFKTPGAQPRNYSTWLADSVSAIDHVWPDQTYTTGLLDDLIENYEQWENRHWVEEKQMFWQTGMADGMETNIASRQTQNWFSGAPGYRPTLNSYLYADAVAIAAIARRAGRDELAEEYEGKATALKEQVEQNLWDPEREFFFPMYRDTETFEGHTVEAGSLTHQTGRFAGSPHGRELIGYVPWQFNLPSPGHESAWKFLMDEDYFFAERGPTVTERNDPLFSISPNCCVWSGNSWPYATGQTLKAMANALQNYDELPISAEEYAELLNIYALTHRKSGLPYIAEACHPDTGSWGGHDHFNHSEHYFHSTYIDLIVTGLIGLVPQSDDSLRLQPLIPESWDYFCLDRLKYKGRDIAVIWDKDGSRYDLGAGLFVLADGEKIAQRSDIGPIQVDFEADLASTKNATPEKYNVAVNNTGGYWPHVITSSFDYRFPPHKLLDGQYWYLESPPNRWQPDDEDGEPWCGVDFGAERLISEVRVYPLDNISADFTEGVILLENDRLVRTPTQLRAEIWHNGEWIVASTTNNPLAPEGRRANILMFDEPVSTRKIRVVFTPQSGCEVAISEIEAWGPAELPLSEPSAQPMNLAAGASITASTFNRPDPPENAIDGVINYDLNGRPNRWATERRPNEIPVEELGDDYLEIDFQQSTSFNEVRLHFCRSRYGMGTPVSFELQIQSGEEWISIRSQTRIPEEAVSETINVIRFPEVETQRLRLFVVHGAGKPVTALSEIEVLLNR